MRAFRPFLFGLAAWAVACTLPLDGSGVGWIASRFVLLAALVWLPLALRLLDDQRPAGLPTLIRSMHPIAALMLTASFLQTAGRMAEISVLVWAFWTGLVGLCGLLRLWRNRRTRLAHPDELCIDLGMLALPVGGIWVMTARADLPLMGFTYPITLLTGMHFHYAGFLLPVIVGLCGRLLPRESSGWALYRVLGPAVCLGVWMVAAGIAFAGLAEALAGTVFATLLAALAAILLLQAATRIQDDPLARALLLLGLLATWPAMGLAAVYALSHAGLTSISLETMALAHGTLLAVVFVGCCLLGLARVRPAPHSEP